VALTVGSNSQVASFLSAPAVREAHPQDIFPSPESVKPTIHLKITAGISETYYPSKNHRHNG
jgi:hypothetical protein